jgi:hypothetical protein
MFGKKKQIQPVEQNTPVENLIPTQYVPQVQPVRQVKEVKTAQIISTELIQEGVYRNVIISNVLMGEVGEQLDWE